MDVPPFKVEIWQHDSTAAILHFVPPHDLVNEDISHFTLKLWKDGTYKTMNELNDAARGRLVFQDTDVE